MQELVVRIAIPPRQDVERGSGGGSARSLGLVGAALALVVLAGLGGARAAEIVRFEKLDDEEIASQAFRVQRPVQLHVVCEGAGDGEADEMYAYGWILDARSRQVAWALTPSTARCGRGRNFVFDGQVSLAPGDYVASYASYGSWRTKRRILKLWGKELGRIEIDSDRRKRLPSEARRWSMRLEANDADAGAVQVLSHLETGDGRVIAQMIGMGDSDFSQRAFTLPDRMQVTVYCLGEFDENNDSMADLGWILNADTRKRVWELGPDNFKHAGGAAKNKCARESITLPAGSYVVYYSCDDSHSAGAWNAPPPFDPEFWGLTLWASSEDAARRVQPYKDDEAARTLVSLVRQHNDAYVTQGVTLLRPMQVRVYALGEYAGGDDWADRGWIEDWKTHRRVWEMREDDTRHAGGASKNRMADDIIDLAAGDYVVGYMTDDSHAYRDWNAPPPSDPEHWGVTVTGVGRNFERASFKLFDPEAREDLGHDYLVRMVRVRDNERRMQPFRLERPTRVRIVAVGEGLGQEMFDYGWIENAETSEPVWEMTGRNTRHAGGADKNRIFEGDVLLDKGRYEAHFVTDGSHAWGDWNAARPDRPELWGMTITLASKGE